MIVSGLDIKNQTSRSVAARTQDLESSILAKGNAMLAVEAGLWETPELDSMPIESAESPVQTKVEH